MRLLLIEDDELLGEGLHDFLRAEGPAVAWAHRLSDTEPHRNKPFAAWLVGWQLPNGCGLDGLRAQRRRGDSTPALMLTARDRPADRPTAWRGVCRKSAPLPPTLRPRCARRWPASTRNRPRPCVKRPRRCKRARSGCVPPAADLVARARGGTLRLAAVSLCRCAAVPRRFAAVLRLSPA